MISPSVPSTASRRAEQLGQPVAAPSRPRTRGKGHAETALQVLVEIATNGAAAEGARVSAATAILDCGYGKPRQSVEVEADINLSPRPTVIEFVAPEVGADEGED